MKSSIDILLPELDVYLNKWRTKTIDIAKLGVPSHISIIYPWIESPIDRIQLDELEKIINYLPKISIQLKGIEYFDNHIAYLSIKNVNCILNIQQLIINNFPKYLPYEGKIKNPIPHITIAKSLKEYGIEVSDIENELLHLRNKIFDIDCITVMEEANNKIWEIKKEMKLGIYT